VGGAGFVLTFLPLVYTIYLLITFLELSGYLPRVAFTMDRFTHKLGLQGKSVIPLVMALGCNVPAVLATRTLESFTERLVVASMIPFISCPARLVVFTFFASVFFPDRVHLVVGGLYLLGFTAALLTGLLLKKKLRPVSPPVVIELPPYRLPPLRLLLRVAGAHAKEFVKKAGTVILAASVVVWLLLHLPPGAPPSESLAARTGKLLLPVFKPVGIDDWRATASLVPGFLAREVVLSSMGVLYGVERPEPDEFKPLESLKKLGREFLEAAKRSVLAVFSPKVHALTAEELEGGLREVIKNSFTPAKALSFMVFLLIFTSCAGTYAVMGNELGYRWATGFLLYSFLLAWLLSFIVFRLFS